MVAPVLNGRLVGYARVSTDDQDLSLQIDSLTGLGIDQDDIFTEKISGAKTDRPQLDACLARLQQGDTLVVWRLDRLGRSMHHLVCWQERSSTVSAGRRPSEMMSHPINQSLLIQHFRHNLMSRRPGGN